MAKRKTLDQWIAEAVADNSKDHKISQMTLVHMRGNSPQEIHTFKKFDSDTFSPKALADLFQDKANSYAQDLPGVQTFNLLAFYSTDRPEAQMPFLVRPEADTNWGGLSTEPPSPTGTLQQEMRWREMDRGLIYRQQTTLYEQSLRTMDMQARMIDRMMSERFDTANMVVDLLMRTADNSHKHKMEQMQFERSSTNQALLLKMVPPAVNQLTGKEVFPQATEDTAIIEGFAEHLMKSSGDPMEMMQKLQSFGLPDAMMGLLASRLMKFIEAKQKEQRAKEVSTELVKTSDAENDVGGGVR